MERFKKTIKKIACAAGGAIMVGATLAGALAAVDLADLPEPFVTTAGVFDAYVVVGTMGWNPAIAFNAAAASGLASDIASGINVGAAFAQVATTAAAASDDVSISEGVLIRAAGNDFTYGDDINSIMPSGFDEEDLPVILTEGEFRDKEGDNTGTYDYDQEIEFTTATATLVFDTDGTDDNKPTGPFLMLGDGIPIYTYTLDFATDVTYSNTASGDAAEDLEGNRMNVAAKTYTISEIDEHGTTFDLDGWTLLSGAMTIVQGEYTTQTYTFEGTDYEVEVVIIADIAESVKLRFTYDGTTETTDALDAGDTYELANGVEIGVEEVLPNEGSEAAGADQTTYYIGAQKIEFDQSENSIKINGETLEDYDATVGFKLDAVTFALEEFNFTIAPTDDLYIGPGEEWVDPVFENWKIVFGGLTQTTESFVWDSTDGDEGSFTFTNNDGKEVVMPVGIDAGTDDVAWGDPDEPQFFDGLTTADNAEGSNGAGMALTDGDSCAVLATSGLGAECDDFLFLGISQGGEAHVFRVDNVDVAGDQVKLTDETTNTALNSGNWIDSSVPVETDIGDVTITIAADDITFADIDLATSTGDVQTELGAILNFGLTATAATVIIEDPDLAQDTITFDDATVDTTEEIEVIIDAAISMDDIEDGSDKQVGIDEAAWGIVYTMEDKTDDNKVTAVYPEEEVIANMYFAPTSAITTTISGAAVNINYISGAAGISKTDADFAAAVPTKNVILIGGPNVHELVNDLAVAEMTDAGADYVADTAIIQMVEDAFGDRDALIIAGYDAKDTDLAGKVVATYILGQGFTGELTGDKATINTAGASTVGQVTIA